MNSETPKRAKIKKAALRIAAAAGAAALLAAAYLQVSYMKQKAAYAPYLAESEAVCQIPDIRAGFIPQGLAFDPRSDSLLLTGYMGRGGSSPLYLIDRQGGGAKKIVMQTETGEKLKGHAGGISLYEGTAYVAGSTAGCMYGFSLDELLSAADGASADAEVRIDLKSPEDRIRVSFTATDGELLYAGEFHKSPLFYTHASHAVATPEGRQQAYLFGFTPEADGGAVPRVVYSIPDNVQGACFAGGKLYLSQTDSLFSARILTYDLNSLPAAGTRRVLGAEVPLYVLTEGGAVKITPVAPMSEEILAVDGRLLILYESASDRYRIGRSLGLDRVLSTPLEFFE